MGSALPVVSCTPQPNQKLPLLPKTAPHRFDTTPSTGGGVSGASGGRVRSRVEMESSSAPDPATILSKVQENVNEG